TAIFINLEPIGDRAAPQWRLTGHLPGASMTQGAWSTWSARISSWLLFAAAALAPLPFGSILPTTIALWWIVLGAFLVLAPVRSVGAGQLALVGLAVVVVAAYALVLH